MNIVQNIDDKEKKEILENIYQSFETGYDFEAFLKPFLEAIGLSEVVVTKKSGDGGIDLLGVKTGLDQLDGNDNVQYKVQAKRYKPTSTIPPEKIDALRGNLGFNQKGLFITTAKVSQKAKDEAKTKDPSKPIIVIDGMDLVDICIQKEIACAYRPIFSKDALNEFLSSNKIEEIQNNIETKEASSNTIFVNKIITSNDIRARIISVPSVIADKIANSDETHKISIIVNGKEMTLSFNPKRKFISGVTSILIDNKLVKNDGTYEEKNALWEIINNKIILTIK